MGVEERREQLKESLAAVRELAALLENKTPEERIIWSELKLAECQRRFKAAKQEIEILKDLVYEKNRALQDARELVNQYKSRIDNLGKWIAVTERLPEPEETVLVVLTDGEYQWRGLSTLDQITGWLDDNRFVKVTHWAPMLPLPEEPE